MIKRIINLLPILFLLAVAFFLRFWGIGHHNFPFTYDVGRDLLSVRDLVYNHKFSLIGATSGQQGIFYGPWWYWILAVPFVLSKGNPAFITLFIALTGVLSVLVVYWWGIKYLDKTTGLFLAGVFALAPVFISTTTQIWNPNLLIILTLFELILLSKLKNLSWWQLFIFGFISLLLAEMELVFGAIFLFALAINLLIWQRETLKSKKILWMFFGAFVVELPRMLFELRHQFIEIKSLPLLLNSQQPAENDKLLRLKIFWEHVSAIFPSLTNSLQIGILVVAGILFLGYLITDKNKEKVIFAKELTVFVAIFLTTTLFYNRGFWSYYLTGLPVIFALILALCFSAFKKYLGNKYQIIVWLLAAIYLLILSEPAKVIAGLRNPYFTGDAAVYRNQEQTLDYIYSQAQGQKFNYIAYTPPLIDYTWQYLFWWYGKNKYGYMPVKNRQERFYVIIEPDSGYPDRIKDWLKIRENDGKIVKEYTLPSGIMVQTRTRPRE